MLMRVEIQCDRQTVSRLGIEMLVNSARLLAAKFNQTTANYVGNTIDRRSLRRCSRGCICCRLLLLMAAYLLWLQFYNFGTVVQLDTRCHIFVTTSCCSSCLSLGGVMTEFTIWLSRTWYKVVGSGLFTGSIIIWRLLLSWNSFAKVEELDLLNSSWGCYRSIAGDPCPCRSNR